MKRYQIGRDMYKFVVPSECVPVAHDMPLGAFASSARPEQILIPGATISGLMRPSRLGPWLEMFATLPALEPVSEVPTERTFFAVEGAET